MASLSRRLIICTYFAQAIVWVLAANLSQPQETIIQQQERTLFIGSMAPVTGKRAWWGAGIPLAIKMAFEDINARSDILKGYRLELIPRDTQVSEAQHSRMLTY